MVEITRALFSRIVEDGNVFFKQQQCEDPDLTEEEKLSILTDLYLKKKVVFVQRYGKYMQADDYKALREGSNDGTLDFILDKAADEKSNINVRNRRYLALGNLRSKKFFSDEKMREREPYLYDVMIGRFLDERERSHLRPSVEPGDTAGGFGELLSQFEATEEIAQRRNVQQELWEGSCTSASSSAENRRMRLMAHVNNMMDTNDETSDDEGDNLDEIREQIEMISREEAESLENFMEGTAEQLRGEFDAFMVERFLAGKDSRFFDYSAVDNDDSLDDNDVIRERDVEERWFDED